MAVGLPNAARSLAAGSFLVAGAVCLGLRQLTGERWAIYGAFELLVIGTGLPAAVVLDSAMHHRQVMALHPPARLLILVPALTVLGIALLRHRPPARQVCRTIAAVGLATVAIVGLVVLAIRPGTVIRTQGADAIWLYVESAAAAGWTAAAAHTWRHRAEGPATLPWIALGMLMMAGCEGLEAASVIGSHRISDVVAGFQLAAGVLALSACTSRLLYAFRAESRQSREITRALHDTQRNLAQVEQRERVRLHDARSAVIGVIGASELLAAPTPPAVDPTMLRRLMTDELERLRSVLDGQDCEPSGCFSVADAFGPVVLSHQLDKVRVRAYVDDDLRAVGRPRALATVLDNLLTNVRVHAPDANVEVRAARIGDTVIVTVDDDGPGIPQSDRARVLRPGVRGATSGGPGSGLGLYSSACTMADQGGTLRILGRPGGGTRAALTIPAATRAADSGIGSALAS